MLNQKNNLITSKISGWWFWGGLIVSLASIAVITVFVPVTHDEPEFYQTAWMMSQGKCIYRDFFQHHNPLAYWLYMPLLKVLPTEVTLKNILVMRLPTLVIFLVNMTCLYYLFRKIFTSTIAAIGIFLLTIWPLYLSASILPRPDGPMVLCLVLGLCAIFKKNSSGVGAVRWLICGLLCGLAFCFLQKAIPFTGVIFLILLWRAYRRIESWKAIIAFMAGWLLIAGIFIAVITHTTGWGLYWACCWKFNMAMPTESPIGLKRAIGWAQMMMYDFIPLWGLLGIFFAWRRNVPRDFIFFAVVAGYGSYALAPFRHQQYAIFMMISAAPFAAFAFNVLYEKYGKKFLWAIIIFMLLTAPQYLVRTAIFIRKYECQQLDVYSTLNKINPGKRYVFSRHFYLFCSQPDYVWFNWDYIVPAWRKSAPAGDKFKVQDYVTIVKQYNPLMIDTALIPQASSQELERAGYRQLNKRFPDLEENLWYNGNRINFK